jgi:predicted GH43/DUF377 family glycosyl hydrolase
MHGTISGPDALRFSMTTSNPISRKRMPPERDIITHSRVILKPDPSRTVIRPFSPADPQGFVDKDHPRAQRIVDRVLALDDAALHDALKRVNGSLADRHANIEDSLLRRFHEIEGLTIDRNRIGQDQALLIAAYFSEEYSFEAAALFNPSIVLHPDQSGLGGNAIRFIMALRGIGEGHVSSVTFRTGTWAPGRAVKVDTPGSHATTPRIEKDDDDSDDIVRIICGDNGDISESVIFPVTPSQRQGIEDLRLVRFVDDDEEVRYLGTYTAFSGAAVRQEMLRAFDFQTFEMRPVTGSVSAAKGMALFPRRIDGRYMMLGRQDNENIWLLSSDDPYNWSGGQKIITPQWPWEYVQVGNCGSPIEIDEGWLVITHGVGIVRHYCIGASLLDKKDPSKVLGRTRYPLIRPGPKQRDGYVPNVVYSCGGLVHDRTLLLPYGVADSFTTFATITVDDVLGAMR